MTHRNSELGGSSPSNDKGSDVRSILRYSQWNFLMDFYVKHREKRISDYRVLGLSYQKMTLLSIEIGKTRVE